MKPSLAEAAGKYLHADQMAPLSPYAISKGLRYQDLQAEHFGGRAPFPCLFFVSPHSEAKWGSGSYAIAADGKLTLAHYHYDSSD